MTTVSEEIYEKLPRIDLQRVAKYRKQLADAAFFAFVGMGLRGETFDSLVDSIQTVLPRVVKRVICDSIRDLAGQTLTRKAANDTAYRLGGNVDQLRSGVAVPPWHVQSQTEWMPVQVIGSESAKRRRSVGRDYRMRILAGTACSLTIAHYWANNFVSVVARRIGYSAPWGRFPLQDPREMVNMRLLVQVTPERCHGSRPGFDKVTGTPGLISWNRKIIKMRQRDGFDCPHDYTHQCFRCPVGYLDCSAAVHRVTGEEC